MLPDYLTVSRCARSRVDFVPDPSRYPSLSAPAHQCQLTLFYTSRRHPVPSSPRRHTHHPNRTHVFYRNIGVLFVCRFTRGLLFVLFAFLVVCVFCVQNYGGDRVKR